MDIKLKYIARDVDRNGNVRLYFRKSGKKIRLRGPEGSLEFLSDYQLALLGDHPKQKAGTKRKGAAPESIRELIEHYYRSAPYRLLSPRTRHVRRLILDKFCESNNDGAKPYAALEAHHLMRRRDEMLDRPEAANSLIKALRQVFDCAKEYGLYDRNPAREVKILQTFSEGHTAWTEDDIKNFETVHPIGSMARLAFSLALYTGQRKGDLITLGPQHIESHNGQEGLAFTQQKNRGRKPVDLWVPIEPELREIISASPIGSKTFIVTEFGRPFSSGGFGNKFRKWCNEAGLKGLSVHGLRKTAANFLAEVGCTDREIMSITGHTTSKEVSRYTRKAKQKIRAVNAIGKVGLRKMDATNNFEKQGEKK